MPHAPFANGVVGALELSMNAGLSTAAVSVVRDSTHALSPTATLKPLRQHAENAHASCNLDEQAHRHAKRNTPGDKPGVLRVVRL